MSTWWRRNRWALLALPFAIALTMAAASYRILTSWNPTHATEPVTAAPGGTAHLVQEMEDAGDGYTIDVELSAGPVTRPTTAPGYDGEDVPVPDAPGTVVWLIPLEVSADPETILQGCALRLVDEEGRETTYSSIRPGVVGLPFSPCVPPETPGPAAESGLDIRSDPTPPRPETYTVPIYFRTSEDFVPVRLDVSWQTPVYAALELSVEGD